MEKTITLEEAITRDLGEIGTPERDTFEIDIESELGLFWVASDYSPID